MLPLEAGSPTSQLIKVHSSTTNTFVIPQRVIEPDVLARGHRDFIMISAFQVFLYLYHNRFLQEHDHTCQVEKWVFNRQVPTRLMIFNNITFTNSIFFQTCKNAP